MKALLLLVAACGMPAPTYQADNDAQASCQAYEPPAGMDLQAPSVSFKTDVMPILSASCSSASCHGVASGAAGDLFLGAELKHGSDSATVYSNLMATSGQVAGMPYVTPGDPTKSYIMHKMDADQCTLDAQCQGGSCQHTMPYDGQLPVEKRDVLRRWIAQGAANN